MRWHTAPDRTRPAGRTSHASFGATRHHILSVDGVEGPLDWLLEMARAKKLDLAKLSIAALIGQFADALAAARRPAGTPAGSIAGPAGR